MDSQQLESLYRANFQKVYNYAYYRLLNAAEAEDATSTTFVKAIANFDRFDPSKASFSTWVLRICHNVIVDRYRANKPSVPIDEIKYDEPSSEDEYPVRAARPAFGGRPRTRLPQVLRGEEERRDRRDPRHEPVDGRDAASPGVVDHAEKSGNGMSLRPYIESEERRSPEAWGRR